MNRQMRFLFFSILIFLNISTTGHAASKFQDIPKNHWAGEEINYLVEKDIIKGYPDGIFGADNSVTRAVPIEIADGNYYPFVKGLKNQEAESKINEVLFDQGHYVKKEYDDIQQTKEEMQYYDSLAKHYTFDSYYKVKRSDDKYISILFYEYGYFGGAHGLYWYKSYTFDVNTGELLALSDVLPNDQSIMAINSEIQHQVDQIEKNKSYQVFYEYPIVEKDAKNFYLTDKGISVFYSLYEYTPYAYGIPEFVIPYSILQ